MLYRIFDQKTFYKEFARDLREARGLVLIQSPFISDSRINKMQDLLESCIKRGVRVCVFVQEPFESDRLKAIDQTADRLRSMGVHVTFRKLIHEKLAIVDESILWDGSLNILSQSVSSERMTRWANRQMVFAALAKHNLGSCGVCMNRGAKAPVDPARPSGHLNLIGKSLAARRKSMLMSQAQLAKECGVSQAVISRIETGKRSVQTGSVIRACLYLNLELRLVPWYFTPALDDLCGD